MRKSLNRKTGSKDISIRTVIFIVFIIILVTAIGIIGYISYSNTIEFTNDKIIKTVDILNKQIVDEIDRFMTNSQRLNIINQKFLENNIIDISNEANRERLFIKALNAFDCEEVYSFSYGTEKGEYYGARRNKDYAIEIMRNNEQTGGHTLYYSTNEDETLGELVLDAGEFDSRIRPWYKVAKEKDRITFSPIYKHFILDDLAISSSVPIYDNNKKIQGVLGTHINLSRINDYLKDIVVGENAYTIIFERGTQELIANSLNKSNFKTTIDGNFSRISIDEIINEAVKKSYNNYINKGINNYKVDYENENLYINFAEYKDEGLDWIIMTVLEDSLIVAPLKKNIRIALILTFVVIFISSIAFFALTKKYITPINNLIQAQEKFANGDLLKRATIVRNDEIGLVGKSFNSMANTIYDLVNTLEEKVEERTSEINLLNKTLIENKNHLELILNSTAEGIFGVDLNMNCTFINDSGLNMLAYDKQSDLIGKNMHFAIHHSNEDGKTITVEECNIFQGLKRANSVHIDDEIFWKKDGTYFNVEYYSYPQYLNDQIVGAVITFTDNTELKKMEEIIFTEKEYFRTTLLSVGDGIISTDNQGLITIMNPASEKLTGWSIKEAYGKKIEEVLITINELNQEVFESLAKKVLESGEIIKRDSNIVLVSKNKKMIPIENIASPIRDRDGNISGVVIIIRDYTDKKEKLERIEYLSMHDHLTGLYNRWYMEDSMNRLDTERNLPLTIMMVDVNGLKLVNDIFGHNMGDELLKTISKILKNIFRTEDIIGRIGGDEILILLPKTDAIQAHNIKKRIIESTVKEKLGNVIVSVAIGYSVKELKNEKLEDIIISADKNMYKDKLKNGEIMKRQTIEKILCDIREKYDYEEIHLEKVSKYCELIGIAMGFKENEVQEIKTAAKLHDIGKIIISSELLNKPEKLTDEEFEIVKKHPETGYRILKLVDEYTSFAEDILYHHERWDGSGYPKRLKGEEIPLNSRIISVADAYEAMTEKRSYKKTKNKEEAIIELKRCSGTQFDPSIVELFIKEVLN